MGSSSILFICFWFPSVCARSVICTSANSFCAWLGGSTSLQALPAPIWLHLRPPACTLGPAISHQQLSCPLPCDSATKKGPRSQSVGTPRALRGWEKDKFPQTQYLVRGFLWSRPQWENTKIPPHDFLCPDFLAAAGGLAYPRTSCYTWTPPLFRAPGGLQSAGLGPGPTAFPQNGSLQTKSHS